MTHSVEVTCLPSTKLISDYLKGWIGEALPENEAAMMDYCQKLGKVYLGLLDGEFVCCWGLIPGSFLSTQAYLWMWSQPGPMPARFTFIRQSQIQVRAMLDRYPTIIGHCKRNALSSQRWLRWLGAEFEPTAADILPFTIRSTP